jgi:hypothetical protein
MIVVTAAAEELFRASFSCRFFVSDGDSPPRLNPATAGLAYAPDAIAGGAGCPTS